MLDEWWFVFERYECEKQHLFDCQHIQTQKRKSPAFARLSCKSWRETRDSNPGDAINVRRFSRPLCKFKQAGALKVCGVPLFKESDRATDRILQGVRFLFWNYFPPFLGVLPTDHKHNQLRSSMRSKERLMFAASLYRQCAY